MTQSDERTRKRVLEALLADPRLSSQPIQVLVDRGNVVLAGSVQSFRRMVAAQEIAMAAYQEGAIENRLDATPPENPTDEEIADEVRALMEQESGLVAQAIVTEVRAGRVTTSGTVADESERMLAEDIALQAPGARTIVNQLMIDPEACTEAVRTAKELEFWLKSAPELAGSQLRVATSGDIAALYGFAKNQAQLDCATALIRRAWKGNLRIEVSLHDGSERG